MKWIILVFSTVTVFLGCNNTTQPIKQPNKSNKTDSTERLLTNTDLNFALINSAGNEIVVFDDEINKDSILDLSVAFTEQGVIPIHYSSLRKSSEEFNGRQTSANFELVPGALFTLNPTIKKDNQEDYILVGSDFFKNSRQPLAVKNELKSIKPNQVLNQLVEKHTQRVQDIKLIASTSEKDSIFLASMYPKADSTQVWLICTSPKREPIYYSYAAQYDSISTWRADDGGHFPIEDFKILQVFKHHENIELVTSFPGPEGGLFSFLVPVNNKFIVFKEVYAYWSPM